MKVQKFRSSEVQKVLSRLWLERLFASEFSVVQEFRSLEDYNTARISISTSPPLGKAATATAERAGNGAEKSVE